MQRVDTPEEQKTLADNLTIEDVLLQIRRFVLFCWRSKWFLLGGLMAGLVLGATAFVLAPSQKSARFQVRLVPQVSENPIAQYSREKIEFFSSAQQNFTSYPLIRETLENLGEQNVTEARLSEVARALRFYSIGYQTYEGELAYPDQQWAVQFLDRHLELYFDREINKTLSLIRAEKDFLEQELAKIEAELLSSEEALKVFQQQHADGLPAQAREHTLQLKKLEGLKIELESDLEQIALELALNRDKINGEKLFVESRVVSTQRAQPYQDSIVLANKKIAEAKAAGVSDNHPEMIRLNKLAAQLNKLSESSKEKFADKEVEQKRNPIYESIQDVIYHLEVKEQVKRNKLSQVKESLAKARKIVEQLPELEATYRKLTRDYAINQDLYDKLFEQVQVINLQYTLEEASAKKRCDVILPPQPEFQSKAKKAIMFGGLGIFLGLLLGFVSAGTRELLPIYRRLVSNQNSSDRQL